jgi:hypothetical protein
MGGALTNCGGTVETRGDGPGDERGGQGGSGFVGVPITGGYQGTIAGATGIGFGGYVGTCCPGTGGTTGIGGYDPGAGAGGYVGVPPLGGQGGEVVYVGAGAGPYDGGAGGVGGEVGVPPLAGASWGPEGGSGGDDGI